MAMAPAKDNIPLSTIETAKDDTAVEDCMMTVEINPTMKDTILLLVSFFMMASRLLPAAAFNSALNELKPYRKSMMALMAEKTI